MLLRATNLGVLYTVRRGVCLLAACALAARELAAEETDDGIREFLACRRALPPRRLVNEGVVVLG